MKVADIYNIFFAILLTIYRDILLDLLEIYTLNISFLVAYLLIKFQNFINV